MDNLGSSAAEKTLSKLRDRFVGIWQRHALAEISLVEIQGVSLKTFAHLIEMYQAPWRSYHNISHIEVCLNCLDACKNHAEFPDSIELAIWFHDCVYAVSTDDNEIHSRDWFIKQSEGYLHPQLVATIGKLIMDTNLNEVPDSTDGKLLADIDLTSFALPWEQYMLDSEAVENELTHCNASNAELDKTVLLSTLLAKKQIYYSPYYLQHFEQMAQQNIRKHLALLSA